MTAPRTALSLDRGQWLIQRFFSWRRSVKARTSSSGGTHRPLAPHSLFFLIYTAIYFVPLWIVGMSGYGEGMVAQTGTDAYTLMNRISALYLIGCTAFLLGSWSTSKLAWLLGGKENGSVNVARIPIYQIDKPLLAGLIIAFIALKILLIPVGVYTSYAFDSSAMETPIWNASMFFSESLGFVALLTLFSNLRHNVLVFTSLSLLNGINLLHGTRNFFVVSMTGAMLYAYVRKGTSLLKIALYGIASFSGAVCLAYLVYLHRQHAAFSDFSIVSVLSPITFESVFSQISLITVLGHPQMYENFGHANRFIQDVVVFTSPRFLVPNKNALLWTIRFGELSPLGASNGFAMGLLYFGYLLPLAYFLLGLGAGVLRRMATGSFGAALYVYFCCDFVYRVQRDGYVIPAKMMINNVQILCILGIIHLWRRRSVAGSDRTHPVGPDPINEAFRA